MCLLNIVLLRRNHKIPLLAKAFTKNKMSQEPYKSDNKSKIPKIGRPSENGESPRKGPKFSIYWVYAIIFAVLIGFQLFNPLSSTTAKTTPDAFKQMVASGDVEKYIYVDNRDIVRVYLKKDSIAEYQNKPAADNNTKINTEGPHYSFTIGSNEDVRKEMTEFYVDNNIPKAYQPIA